MEENEVILLKNSRMYVARLGRKLNVFSIVTFLCVLFMVVGGIFMLYISNLMDDNLTKIMEIIKGGHAQIYFFNIYNPYYLYNIIGLGGVAAIFFAAALVPSVMYMRRAVKEANQVKISQELYPVVGFLRELQKFWKYSTTILTILFIAGVIALIIAIYFVSTHTTVM